MRRLFLFLFIGFNLCAHGQDLRKIAEKHLVNIASNEMFGRGYVNNGYERAAIYVENEFKNMGLIPIKNSYRQFFTYPVNSFPDTVLVSFNGIALKPGVDYIVDPACPSVKGNYNVIYYSIGELYSKEVRSFSKNDILVSAALPKSLSKDSVKFIKAKLEELNMKVPLIELTSDKLTWSVSTSTQTHARIQVKSEKWNPDIADVQLHINNKFIPSFTSSNVIGYIKAKKKKCKDYLVITAHLDHLGMMGSEAIFNGANDNASGITAMLLLARYYSENKPDLNIVFIAFGGEEAGLIGSKYFVENPLIKLEKIKFLFNIDLMGNGEDGVTIVNATLFKKQFDLLKSINEKNDYLTQIKPRGEAANSDHYWFTKKGVPSFFMYTLGGSTAYHDVFDRPEQLPMNEVEDLQSLLIEFLNKVSTLK